MWSVGSLTQLNRIFDNIIYENLKNGIFLNDAGINCLNGNEIRDNALDGIEILSDYNAIESNNILSNGKDGIHLYDCWDNRMVTNYICWNNRDGIYMEKILLHEHVLIYQ